MDIVICDDEALARERLVRMVTQLGHCVVAQANNGKQAIAAVEKFRPDAILLDIRMPEMNGLDCAVQLSQLDTPPAIVFCTAFDQYAIDAFKTHAMAYLLKPIPLDDLQHALHKATRLNQAQLQALPLQSRDLNSTVSQNTARQNIVARTHRGVELIPIEDIYYFFADQKYVTVRHKHGQVLIDETLKELENEFTADFIRIHRNALISLKHLEGLEMLANGQYQVRCREIDEKLLISRRHLPHIKERMQKL
ncbi:LytTR family DNA-binding domain-containing protein [Acinetobacter puyangensis]|uniref:Two component transcriptional regulator, LytTR family n=1 Tax=Acinetobacter puyangensis TaxID=1096779 RepID=A0A240ECJ2_9GAMM|nr:LytTR family DNA-binding domain-containing protein [Acinetobacter puyangensis]SNX46271.1 two component transcriptional regulator, LytTR family [Acinetobacter puyangensis]